MTSIGVYLLCLQSFIIYNMLISSDTTFTRKKRNPGGYSYQQSSMPLYIPVPAPSSSGSQVINVDSTEQEQVPVYKNKEQIDPYILSFFLSNFITSRFQVPYIPAPYIPVGPPTYVYFPKQNVTLTATACENDYLQLVCPQGQGIYILGCTYGADPLNYCPPVNGSRPANTTCSVNCVSPVSQGCQGRYACTFQAANLYFGDPCPLVRKTARIAYCCY